MFYTIYSNGKVSNCQEWVMMKDKWHCNEQGESVDGGANNYQPAHPEGENSDYANASGLNTDQYGLPSCSKQSVVDPRIIATDNNSDFQN